MKENIIHNERLPNKFKLSKDEKGEKPKKTRVCIERKNVKFISQQNRGQIFLIKKETTIRTLLRLWGPKSSSHRQKPCRLYQLDLKKAINSAECSY